MSATPFADQMLAERRRKLAEGRCPVAYCVEPLPCAHREAAPPKPRKRREHVATFEAFERDMARRGKP